MSENHTPGPWDVVEADEHHGFYVTSEFGSTVCDLYTMTRLDMPSTANGGPSKPVPFLSEMAEGNARLIAAAPDLLEALEGLLDTFNLGSGGVVKIAQDAIAKARGK